MHLKKSLLYFLASLLAMFFYTSSFAATVTFNSTATGQKTFTGFGAMVWTGEQNSNVVNLYQLPGFRMARINHEIRMPSGQTIPNNGTLATYQSLWSQYGDGATDLSGGTQAPVQFMYLASIPCTFINSKNVGSGVCPQNCSTSCSLISNVNLQSLAYYIAAGVQHFTNKYGALTSCPGCYKADFLELVNEPNGTWTTQFTTAQYTQLVKLVYQQLQALGAPYNQTKITGAGVGNIDWSTLNGTDSYTSAVISDSTALANLGAYSVHQYVYTKSGGKPVENIDAGSSINGYGQTAARYYFPKWYATPKSKSSTKPVIVSEVNTTATGFHNKSYNPPSNNYLCTDYSSATCSIVNTTSFGVRMYTYMISLLAGGANSPLYWEAKDQSWQSPGGGYGMVDLNGNYKTNYYAMLPLFQNIPMNSTILVSSSSQPGNDIYSVAFLTPKSGGQRCVVIALANGTGKSGTLARTTTVTNLPKVALTSSTTTLFTQSGSTVYQGQLVSPDPNTTALTLSNGTLTHTTKLANDTTVTVKACYPEP